MNAAVLVDGHAKGGAAGAGYKGGRACEAPDTLQVWQRQSALWLNSACHRSLYSYQIRTALALAVDIRTSR